MGRESERFRRCVAAWQAHDLSGLTTAEKGDVALWRYALAGSFVVTDAEGKLMTLLQAAGAAKPRLFLVQLLERDACELFGRLPCLAELTLLPYHGRIVTSGEIRRVSSVVTAGGLELIERRFKLACSSPPVASARELIAHQRTTRGDANVF